MVWVWLTKLPLNNPQTRNTRSPHFSIMSRSLALLLLLVPPFCSLAQDWNDGNGAYGTYGGGDDNTISPAPQINVTQPAPAPPPSMPPQQQPQPNATAPGGGGTGDNATAFLPITLNNNNSWTMNGRAHEQNNYLMQNMASRSICDVSIKAPIASGDGTRISSSYNVDLRNITAEAMHFDLPFYLQKIWPGQIISFGWVLNVRCGVC